MTPEQTHRIKQIQAQINFLNREIYKLQEEMRAARRERDAILDAAAAGEWSGAA